MNIGGRERGGNRHLGVKLIILSHTNMNYSVVVGRQWVYGKRRGVYLAS